MSSSHTNRLILVTSTITAALLALGVVSSPPMTSTMISGGGIIFNLNQAIATAGGNGEQGGGEQDGADTETEETTPPEPDTDTETEETTPPEPDTDTGTGDDQQFLPQTTPQ